MPASKFDQILSHIGEFGKYQKLQFVLLSTICGVYFGWVFGSTMFIIMPTDHWCNIPPRSVLSSYLQNQTQDYLEELFIPRKLDPSGTSKKDSCFIRDPNNGRVSSNDDSHLVPCPYGWTWDPKGQWLLMNEFSLVCSKSYLLSLMMTVRGIVSPIGMLFLINLTDMIGRKAVIFIVWPFYIIVGLLKLLSPNFTIFFTLNVLETLVSEPIFLVPCMLALEMVGPKQHTFVVNIICMIFAISAAIFGSIAYMCHSWKQQVLVANATFIPMVIGYFFLIDESPRWLLSKGKVDRAMQIVEKMARTNGTTSALDHIHPVCTDNNFEMNENVDIPKTETETSLAEVSSDLIKNNPSAVSILTLFRNRNLALITVLVSFLIAANMLVYVGLTYSIPNFGGNRYLIFSVMALIEIPSCLFNFIIDKTGRIWPFGITLLLSGVGLLAASLTPPNLVGVVVTFVVISKFTITASFNIAVQVGGELYPTVLRVTGTGVCATISRIVSSLAPFLAYSASVFHALPTLIMSGMALTGGVLVFFLPETMNHTLPETVDDTEHGQGVGMKSFWMNIRCNAQKRRRTTLENY